jgi:hypothetical protein
MDLHTSTDIHSEDQMNEQLLQAAVKLNTRLLALIFACVFGFSLFSLTFLSLYRGLPDTGQYLNLLGVFLPGYEVSHKGAWIGLLWGAAFGALIATVLYRVYARGIDRQIRQIRERSSTADQPAAATMYLDGNSLGLALGSIAAVGLIISTNWLVFRGTAEQSIHAMLLVNYLPGYAINFTGSIIAAMEIFVLAYLLSLLFSRIYNAIAARRDMETG